MCLVLVSWSRRLLSAAHDLTLLRVFFTLSTQTSGSFRVAWCSTVVSSAYWKQEEPSCRQYWSSFAYRLKTTNPRIEPCGTPNGSFSRLDRLSLTFTNCRRSSETTETSLAAASVRKNCDHPSGHRKTTVRASWGGAYHTHTAGFTMFDSPLSTSNWKRTHDEIEAKEIY